MDEAKEAGECYLAFDDQRETFHGPGPEIQFLYEPPWFKVLEVTTVIQSGSGSVPQDTDSRSPRR